MLSGFYSKSLPDWAYGSIEEFHDKVGDIRYVTCNAYDMKRQDIEEKIRKLNKDIIEHGDNEVPLIIDDFSFMISKLCEIVNEYLPLGDVILVPDGPKPLIFAMALVPQILQKEGGICIFVSRNRQHYKPIKVSASGSICGFSVI